MVCLLACPTAISLCAVVFACSAALGMASPLHYLHSLRALETCTSGKNTMSHRVRPAPPVQTQGGTNGQSVHAQGIVHQSTHSDTPCRDLASALIKALSSSSSNLHFSSTFST